MRARYQADRRAAASAMNAISAPGDTANGLPRLFLLAADGGPDASWRAGEARSQWPGEWGRGEAAATARSPSSFSQPPAPREGLSAPVARNARLKTSRQDAVGFRCVVLHLISSM